jgi:aldehyde dehydrogenase (NAD+)
LKRQLLSSAEISQMLADAGAKILTTTGFGPPVFGVFADDNKPRFRDGKPWPESIVDGVRPGDALFREETFGPLVSVTTYASIDEAIELANAPGYGLSSCIYTNDPREVFRFRRGIGAGMVSVNNSTSGAEAHLPFGGNGKSGNGSRQSGVWVLDQFTRWQAMNWDYSGHLQKAQMDVAELAADYGFRLGD